MTSELHASDQRRRIDAPEPGYFSMRLVHGGWRVPCRIVHDENGWYAVVNGNAEAPADNPHDAARVSRIWEHGLRIDQPTYDWLIALKAYAETHEPDHPAANVQRAIDPNQLQPIQPRTPLR